MVDVVRGRSGGVRTWVVQRLSAVYIALFLVMFLVPLISEPPANYYDWRAIVASPLINIAFICFWIATITHAWIGMRDVIMDYVHDDSLRFIVLSLTGLFLLFMAVWLVKILIMVGL